MHQARILEWIEVIGMSGFKDFWGKEVGVLCEGSDCGMFGELLLVLRSIVGGGWAGGEATRYEDSEMRRGPVTSAPRDPRRGGPRMRAGRALPL